MAKSHIKLFALSSEKGASLLISLFAIGFAGFIVAGLQTIQYRLIKDQGRAALHKKRNEFGEKIKMILDDPDYLNASAVYTGEFGNTMLHNCIHKDSETPSGLCVPANPADPVNHEYPLLVRTTPTHPFPGAVYNQIDSNCPGQRSPTSAPQDPISCFLAGKRGSKEVGYDSNGNSGPWSKFFPFKLKVFFRPTCSIPQGSNLNQDSPSLSCSLADSILLRYELEHWDFSGGQIRLGILGVYPLNLSGGKPAYRTLGIADIRGIKCPLPNESIIRMYPNGAIECDCLTPYSYNANMTSCEIKAICLPGQQVIGKDDDGNDVCSKLELSVAGIGESRTLCVSTVKEDCNGYPNPTVNCMSADNPDGLVQSVNSRCVKQQMAISPIEGPRQDNLLLKIILGASAVGSGLLAIYAGVGTLGASFLMGAVILAIILILILLLTEPEYHLYVSEPVVTCLYDVVCASWRHLN